MSTGGAAAANDADRGRALRALDARLGPRWPLFILLALSVPLILWRLGSYSLVNGDEEIYHVVARTMVETGDPFRLQFYDEHRVYDTFMNAPLQYWARAVVIALFGDNMWTARILSALAAIASVTMTWRLGLHVGGRLAAFIAGAVQLTTLQFLYLHGARTGELEPAILLLYTAAAWLFLRATEEDRSFIGHHVCLALMLVLKAPTILLPLLAEAACFALLPETRRAFGRYAKTALVVLPLGGLWHLAQMVHLWGPFQDVIGEMLAQASTTGRWSREVSRADNALFYGRTMLFGAFPWVLAWPVAALDLLLRPRAADDRRRTVVLALFALAVLVFFTLVSKHHRWYVMPAYPLLSVLLGLWAARLYERPGGRPALAAMALVVSLFALLQVNLGYHPFLLKAWGMPMRVGWRTIAGLEGYWLLPLLAGACFGLLLVAARGRALVPLLPLLLCGVLGTYALVRVSMPLRFLGHQSEMALLRAELDALERAGTPAEPPIEPTVSIGWDARYYLADRYRIERIDGRRFLLHPLPDAGPGR